MVRKKSGMPQPTSRKIKEHAMKEGKSFLVRNGYAMLLATHTAKGTDTMDNTMNNEDISQHLRHLLQIYYYNIQCYAFLSRENQKEKVKKGGVTSTSQLSYR